MSTGLIVTIIVVGVLLAAAIVLFIVGRRMQKKQNEQRDQMEANAQVMSMLIIDKKRVKLKDANLPPIVMQEAPRLAKMFGKYPVAKCKVGPKILTLMVDEQLYDILPVKKECKVSVSGIYILKIISCRGGLEQRPKKRTLRQRIFKRING